MKLVSYRHNGAVRIGAVVDDQIVHLNGLLPAAEAIPDDMVEFLKRGDGAMDAARRAVARYEAERPASAVTSFASCDLLSPVPRPGKILMGGRNYLRHLDELRKEGASRGEKIITPPMPHIFAKYHNSVTGHGKPIIYPRIVKQLDLEGELTAVIGKTAYYVEERDALDYVAGYTIMNDVSARCLQAQGLLTIAKGFETFCPIGPWMVTKDEIPDPHALDISLEIGGETLQSSNTREMVFRLPELIEYVSSAVTLEPGDVFATGTPAGVGFGRKPPRWLKPGEEVIVRISGIGELRNPTIAE